MQIATASVVVRSISSSVSAQNLEPEEQMPKYGSLKADDTKGLVAYIRALKKWSSPVLAIITRVHRGGCTRDNV